MEAHDDEIVRISVFVGFDTDWDFKAATIRFSTGVSTPLFYSLRGAMLVIGRLITARLITTGGGEVLYNAIKHFGFPQSVRLNSSPDELFEHPKSAIHEGLLYIRMDSTSSYCLVPYERIQ